jgi:hypothetical protein
MADWQAIKTEYITTNTSYRKLAQKYALNYKSVADRGKAENWVEQRNQYHIETQSKIIAAKSNQEVDRAARILNVADKLLNKIDAILESVEPADIPAKAIRALTAAVKDLKDIQGVKSKLDEQEQEARIANLRKQSEKDDNDTDVIEVVFAAGPEEWNE